MFKQIVLPSFIVFSLIFVFINFIYGVTHYGFGGVVVPDWYIKENGLVSSPISPTPFVKYWLNRGLMFSSIYGAIAFILTFIFTMLRYRKTKNLNLVMTNNDGVIFLNKEKMELELESLKKKRLELTEKSSKLQTEIHTIDSEIESLEGDILEGNIKVMFQ